MNKTNKKKINSVGKFKRVLKYKTQKGDFVV